MNLTRRKKSINTSFSLSSMTDIVFLLLIFFMITTTYGPLEGVEVNLPKSDNSQSLDNTLTIKLNQVGEYYINDELMDNISIKLFLSNYFNNADNNSNQVIIEADKDVNIESFIKLADILSAMNLKISIATIRE